jgi:hypothetical protein
VEADHPVSCPGVFSLYIKRYRSARRTSSDLEINQLAAQSYPLTGSKDYKQSTKIRRRPPHQAFCFPTSSVQRYPEIPRDTHPEVAIMSFLKKPFKKLKEINNGNSPNNTSTDFVPSKTEGISSSPWNGAALNGTTPNGGVANGTTPHVSATPNGTHSLPAALATVKAKGDSSGTSTPERSDSRRQSREILELERKRRSIDKGRVKAETKKRESMARIEDERFLKEGPPALTKLYRPYSMNMSKRWNADDRILFKNVNWEEMDGRTLKFRARIHTLRRMSAKLVFIVFRQQTITIQGVLQSFKPHGQVEGMSGFAPCMLCTNPT